MSVTTAVPSFTFAEHEIASAMNEVFNALSNKISIANANQDYWYGQWNTEIARRNTAMDNHSADMVTIGAVLRQHAIKERMCSEFEDFINDLVRSLNKGDEFGQAASRTQTYKVVVTFTSTVDAINESSARDEVHSNISEHTSGYDYDLTVSTQED